MFSHVLGQNQIPIAFCISLGIVSRRPLSRMNTTFQNSDGCLHLHGQQKKNIGRPQQCRPWKKTSMLLSKKRGGLTSSGMKQRIMRRRMKEINQCMRQLKAEMQEISKEQESIRQGQKEVREKFEAIESECQQLRNDTSLVARQSVITKLRLALMFQILKARHNNDLATATLLTRILREMMANNKQV